MRTNFFARPAARPLRRNVFIMAADRASVRALDRDGRLHVAETPISKAMICVYHATEIPNWQQLGLDANKTYKLFRDPEELAATAATFNNLPLLKSHSPVSAAEHKPELVIGATGSNATFKAPYLLNDIVIWDQDYINAVEDGTQKELSAAYYYKPDMTPGYYKGEHYDGVMRKIHGSHLCLVSEGRSGKDVCVQDSKEELQMHKLSRMACVIQGALTANIRPILAMDAKIDLAPYLIGITAANFREKQPEILRGVARACAGRLAQDAALDPAALQRLLTALEGIEPPAEDPPAAAVVPPKPTATAAPAVDDDPADKLASIKTFLEGHLSPEDLAQLNALAAPAVAQDQDEPSTPESDAREDEEAAALGIPPRWPSETPANFRDRIQAAQLQAQKERADAPRKAEIAAARANDAKAEAELSRMIPGVARPLQLPEGMGGYVRQGQGLDALRPAPAAPGRAPLARDAKPGDAEAELAAMGAGSSPFRNFG